MSTHPTPVFGNRAADRLATARGYTVAMVGVLIAGMFAAGARAERLPIRVYTTADGLASSVVLDVFADSRGFVWFATRNGLSRFDGSEFRTYTTDDGLPNPVVNDVIETSTGDYWIATNGGGLCQLHTATAAASRPGGAAGRRPSLFTCHQVGDNFLSNRVNALREDRQRRIWMTTDNGVFRMEQSGGARRVEPVEIGAPAAGQKIGPARALYEDSEGRMWIGLTRRLLRLNPDGSASLYTIPVGRALNFRHLVEHDGALWVGLDDGLLAFRPEPRQQSDHDQVQRTTLRPVRPCIAPDGGVPPVPAAAGEACFSDERSGLPHDFVGGFARDAAGRLWICAGGRLVRVDGGRLVTLSAREILAADNVAALTHDRQGQLWIATNAGALKLTPDGLVTYGTADGLGNSRVRTLFARAGQLFVVSGDWVINRFDGDRFRAVQARVPDGSTFGYYSHAAFLDRSGRWWLLTDRGLFGLRVGVPLEYSARAPPDIVVDSRHGLPADRVDRVFEDSRGDLWLATRLGRPTNLGRWERATGIVRQFREGLGPEHELPMAFAEDRHGAVWIGFEGGGLARYLDGRFTIIALPDPIPFSVTALHLDGSGRLWISSSNGGVRVLHDPADRSSRVDRYGTAEGLSSSNVQCIVEDRWGRIYFGTSRGIDRLDPATGRIRHFTTSDGLASGYVVAAARDESGALWFGTHDGVSRLVPVVHLRCRHRSGSPKCAPAACRSRFRSWAPRRWAITPWRRARITCRLPTSGPAPRRVDRCGIATGSKARRRSGQVPRIGASCTTPVSRRAAIASSSRRSPPTAPPAPSPPRRASSSAPRCGSDRGS